MKKFAWVAPAIRISRLGVTFAMSLMSAAPSASISLASNWTADCALSGAIILPALPWIRISSMSE